MALTEEQLRNALQTLAALAQWLQQQNGEDLRTNQILETLQTLHRQLIQLQPAAPPEAQPGAAQDNQERRREYPTGGDIARALGAFGAGVFAGGVSGSTHDEDMYTQGAMWGIGAGGALAQGTNVGLDFGMALGGLGGFAGSALVEYASDLVHLIIIIIFILLLLIIRFCRWYY